MQAIFPEGGLSLDGRVGAARMGLLSYIVQGFEPGGRDVVFVPVGLAYDRVLEDRLLTGAQTRGTRRFRARPLSIAAFGARLGWRMLRGRFPGFGTAAAGFGPPVSLRAFLAGETSVGETGVGGTGDVEALGRRLMDEIVRVVPVVAVPLVAAALSGGAGPLEARVADLAAQLQVLGAVLKLPPQGLAQTVAEGLEPLVARGIVTADGVVRPEGAALLAFYAAPVLQRLAATRQT